MDELTLPCNCGRSASGYCLGKQVLTAKPSEDHMGSWTPPCDYDLAQKAIEQLAAAESTEE
jgi:hypothetical protein